MTADISVSSMREKIVECLEKQISEYELLKSMYPVNGEIVLTDEKVLEDIRMFLDNNYEYSPNHLDFTLNLHLMDLKLEVCIDLPTLYPEDEPDIYIRCNQLNRQEEKALNNNLYQYLRSSNSGECLYTAISWLQENIDSFKDSSVPDKTLVNINKDVNKGESKFIRMWIYSHHIYNKRKREEIVNKAKDLGLSGFCLPGKPGLICIEGVEEDAKLWWKDIKSMSWKKIAVRKLEEFDKIVQEKEQKFQTFEELHFPPPPSSSRNSKHSNMSGFSKFMEEHGLTGAFNDFFGLCSE